MGHLQEEEVGELLHIVVVADAVIYEPACYHSSLL
jgi:hypothetical protein